MKTILKKLAILCLIAILVAPIYNNDVIDNESAQTQNEDYNNPAKTS